MTIMNKINEEKLKLWQGKLAKIEEDYKGIMQRRGEAMQMGDLRENAALQMLSEDADAYRARIEEVRGIIARIEQEGKG